MSSEGSRITRPLRPGAFPTPPQVQKFLTTPRNDARAGRPPVIVAGTRVALNDDLINEHSVLLKSPEGQALDANVKAPDWLKAAAKDPLKVHRVAQFQLEGGHSLWFVETTTCRAGWFLNRAPSPMFVYEPGTFRAAPLGEDIFAERF